MLRAIVVHVWRETLRDRRALSALVLLAALIAVAVAMGMPDRSRAAAARADAARADREAWLAQGEKNPHSAAHFGQYAFKPERPLAVLDPGLDPFLGTSIWMEAHYQNPASFRPAEDRDSLDRFGPMSAAWLLAATLPLLAIVLAYDRLAGARERGALRLVLAQGVAPSRLLFGTALALTPFVTVPVLATAALGFAWSPEPDGAERAAVFALTWCAYGLVWLLIALTASARGASARGTLSFLLAVWLLAVVVVPRVAADVAERRYPSPPAPLFWEDVSAAMTAGIDGHDPQDSRAKELEAKVLAQHGVERVEDLPISFAGVSLQAGEEFGNGVFDHFHGAEAARLEHQAWVQRAFALVSPLPAARELSRSAAGTDLAHHQHFAAAAEAHRRDLERQLNGEMTAKAKGKDFDWLAAPSFWASVPELRYEPPSWRDLASAVRADALVLAAWLAGAAVLAWMLVRRLGCEDGA